MVDHSTNISVHILASTYSYYGNRKLKISNYVTDLYCRVGLFFSMEFFKLINGYCHRLNVLVSTGYSHKCVLKTEITAPEFKSLLSNYPPCAFTQLLVS